MNELRATLQEYNEIIGNELDRIMELVSERGYDPKEIEFRDIVKPEAVMDMTDKELVDYAERIIDSEDSYYYSTLRDELTAVYDLPFGEADDRAAELGRLLRSQSIKVQNDMYYAVGDPSREVQEAYNDLEGAIVAQVKRELSNEGMTLSFDDKARRYIDVSPDMNADVEERLYLNYDNNFDYDIGRLNLLPKAVIEAADSFNELMYANHVLSNSCFNERSDAYLTDVANARDEGVKIKNALMRVSDRLARAYRLPVEQKFTKNVEPPVMEWIKASNYPIRPVGAYSHDEQDMYYRQSIEAMKDSQSEITLQSVQGSEEKDVSRWLHTIDHSLTEVDCNNVARVAVELANAKSKEVENEGLIHWDKARNAVERRLDTLDEILHETNLVSDKVQQLNSTLSVGDIQMPYNESWNVPEGEPVSDKAYDVLSYPTEDTVFTFIRTGADLEERVSHVAQALIDAADTFDRSKVIGADKDNVELVDEFEARLNEAADKIAKEFGLERASIEMSDIEKITEIAKEHGITVNEWPNGDISLGVPYTSKVPDSIQYVSLSNCSIENVPERIIRAVDSYDPQMFADDFYESEDPMAATVTWGRGDQTPAFWKDMARDVGVNLNAFANDLSAEFDVPRVKLLTMESSVQKWVEASPLVDTTYPDWKEELDLDQDVSFESLKWKSPEQIHSVDNGFTPSVEGIAIARQTRQNELAKRAQDLGLKMDKLGYPSFNRPAYIARPERTIADIKNRHNASEQKKSRNVKKDIEV